jgi:protein dithiol oxidoreductase (disulfide-forming)
VAFGQASNTYAKLAVPQPVARPGKIEVIEFFWYGSPLSYHMEPMLEAWVKKLPADVVFRREHVMWQGPPYIEGHFKLFATLRLMGLLEKYNRLVFDAINKRVELRDEKTLFDWVAKNGIDSARFQATYKSFAIQSQIITTPALTAKYHIDGVPTFIINGKFTTSPGLAGGERQLLATIDQLIGQERTTRGRSAPSSLKATKAGPGRKRAGL